MNEDSLPAQESRVCAGPAIAEAGPARVPRKDHHPARMRGVERRIRASRR